MDAKNITCNKILITGNAGAGKTTFAVALGKKIKRNVIHLDKLIWKENWQLADQGIVEIQIFVITRHPIK